MKGLMVLCGLLLSLSLVTGRCLEHSKSVQLLRGEKFQLEDFLDEKTFLQDQHFRSKREAPIYDTLNDYDENFDVIPESSDAKPRSFFDDVADGLKSAWEGVKNISMQLWEGLKELFGFGAPSYNEEEFVYILPTTERISEFEYPDPSENEITFLN